MYKLRKKNIGGNKEPWSLEEIRIAVESYKEIHLKYPSTLDFDKVDFLPSSRLIQRNFGGVINLRKLLNLDMEYDLTKGDYRSKIAKKTFSRSQEYEESFYYFLISIIPEMRIHEHKILRPGRVCCDFFIYTSDSTGFAVDLFYAQDLYSVARIINIKVKRYKQLNMKVYFILTGNNSLDQIHIDEIIINKKFKLPEHIIVLSESNFKRNIKSYIQ